jgi:hypothetical protein
LEDKFIILYADEFKEDIWKSYMNIFGLSYHETSVRINIKNVIPIELI